MLRVHAVHTQCGLFLYHGLLMAVFPLPFPSLYSVSFAVSSQFLIHSFFTIFESSFFFITNFVRTSFNSTCPRLLSHSLQLWCL